MQPLTHMRHSRPPTAAIRLPSDPRPRQAVATAAANALTASSNDSRIHDSEESRGHLLLACAQEALHCQARLLVHQDRGGSAQYACASRVLMHSNFGVEMQEYGRLYCSSCRAYEIRQAAYLAIGPTLLLRGLSSACCSHTQWS
eukprot:scaffold233506_cov17-Tisochrysis_lutea.AAC.3